MNILPKKRWHVRTRENIARVRRDEAAAAEEELKKQQKRDFAESEARINYLRQKAGIETQEKCLELGNKEDATSENGLSLVGKHIDLFSDYKSHIQTTNKDLEKEKKEEQEKYEKQIGYLTYLGQDTNEALKTRSWYEVAPNRGIVGERNIDEKDLKNKHAHDPLTLINALLPAERKKSTTLQVHKRQASEILHQTTPPVASSNIPSTLIDEANHGSVKKLKKHKKHKKQSKKHKKEKTQNESRIKQELKERQQKREVLEKLRLERLRREESERVRQEALLAPISPAIDKKESSVAPTPRIVQKYNSQFNPELAKQNML